MNEKNEKRKRQISNIKYISEILEDRQINSKCLANQIKLKPQPELKDDNRKLTVLPQKPGKFQDMEIPDTF